MELETNLQDVFGINKPPAYVAYVEEQDFASFLSGGSGSVKVLFDHTASGSGFQKIEFQKYDFLWILSEMYFVQN